MTRHILIAGDGYGCYLESGLKYTTLCGRAFEPNHVDQEVYESSETPDDPHA